MIFTNYIKPSQVFDFARKAHRHTAMASAFLNLSKVRIIYISLKSTKSAKKLTLPYKPYGTKITWIARIVRLAKRNVGPIELLISTPILLCGVIYWAVSL
jgi:hypothetical protein